MFKLVLFSLFLSLFSKPSIESPIQSNSNKDTFNGTLTEDYLLQLGYTFDETSIILINHNITSIAPFTFMKFTKLDSLNLFYNQIEQINATTFKGKFVYLRY